MSRNLVVAVIGNSRSGKSSTWYKLFGKRVSTGSKMRKLFLTEKEYVEVFLVSASPEERKTKIEKIITVHNPRIVLCSMQYREDVFGTINYFTERDYFLFMHWLNPGYADDSPVVDRLGLVDKILEEESLLGIRSGQIDVDNRMNEIRGFIYGWAKMRDLLQSDDS